MTEEERKAKAREYAKKYYEQHKEIKKEQMKEYSRQHRLEHRRHQKDYVQRLEAKGVRQKTQVKKLQERIEMAIKYVEDKGRLKYKPNELKKILRGETSYGNKTNDISKR